MRECTVAEGDKYATDPNKDTNQAFIKAIQTVQAKQHRQGQSIIFQAAFYCQLNYSFNLETAVAKAAEFLL